MKLPSVRFTVRRMMVAIACVALILGSPARAGPIAAIHNCNWWEIKPYLNLILVPGLALVLARPPNRRAVAWAAILLDLLFLALWATARRPYLGSVLLGGEYSDDPFAAMEFWLCGGWISLSDAVDDTAWRLEWMGGGLLIDLVCLTVPLPLLALGLLLPVSGSFRVRRIAAIAASIALVWMRLYDWLIWPRMRARGRAPMPKDVMSFGTLDPEEAPALILDGWFRGEQDIGHVARLIGMGRWLEVVVLVLLLMYVTTRFIRAWSGTASRSTTVTGVTSDL